MNKFVAFLENNLSTPMAKLSEQKHLRAIRDGVVSALPFIIFGSIFLIIAFPPVAADSAIGQWAAKHIAEILIPYRLTMFIMTLYITFGIGHSLSQSYKLDPLSGGLLSVAAFLFTIGVKMVKDIGFVLPMTNLGGHGLFVAMIVSIFSVEMIRLCKTKNITIKMPDSVPTSVSRSFEALIPVTMVLFIMTLITVVAGVDLHSLVDKAVAPLIKAGDTLPGVLIPVFLITFFWSFGIHGVSVVGAVARPVWEVYLANNSSAVAAGTAIPHVAPETFFQWFIWIGGSGATLGLVIAMLLTARSTYSKTMARATIVPSIFNINEPVIFGMPIVLNPILIIPFIVTPLIGATVAYIATSIGLVNPTYVMVPWTLPAPIGAYLSTGGDWRAIILVLVNITISVLVYLPFFKMYDQKLLAQESPTETTEGTNVAL
ncbi:MULTISPECIES: PTS sugar transporter subunit IIC [Bacillus]|uniref:Permease IIC component n=1 Tax=Bacillus pseudomycoides TaxID=64104 RepID=A0A1Y3MBE2_9BACI|nr:MULTISPECIES: PTS sugar transporter subunit IIC [Bacillus cereus group]EOQ17015.1 PTS system, lactose/cellobiose family IIC component [Bacillus cereus VDM021]OOG91012.1 PTS system, cellobiose-specific IIC component [Bacillus mycoides]MDF2086003.1 PTS sugar transporter subunit IIC [Bacillus pseudomycoides]OUM47386.1 PTS lactose transporter subunit IIC [Bacillus pseudomycoides]PEK73106.1 PTS lactose transporter subunit IIC [Bacillus pseudomycoides]